MFLGVKTKQRVGDNFKSKGKEGGKDSKCQEGFIWKIKKRRMY